MEGCRREGWSSLERRKLSRVAGNQTFGMGSVRLQVDRFVDFRETNFDDRRWDGGSSSHVA